MSARTLLAVGLAWSQLLVACQCELPRSAPAAPGASPSAPALAEGAPSTHPEAREYFAEPSGPCGARVLLVSPTESGPFEQVYQIGEQSPDQRLMPHAWYSGRFVVRGYFTGRKRGADYCGYHPEFRVLSFRPWGPVRRCTSVGALDGLMQLYTEELPKDRYAPEDFVEGPELPSLDADSCRPGQECKQGEHLIHDCSGDLFCCRLWVSGVR